MSIIVIGVGYDSFEEMKLLDSDHQMLSSHGKFAKRDIVQFVQLRKFLPPHRELSEDDLSIAKSKLAKEVLAEVPMQLTSYMKSKGIYPRSPSSPFDFENLQTPQSPKTSFYGFTNSLHGSSPSSPRSPRRLLPAEPTQEFSQMGIS